MSRIIERTLPGNSGGGAMGESARRRARKLVSTPCRIVRPECSGGVRRIAGHEALVVARAAVVTEPRSRLLSLFVVLYGSMAIRARTFTIGIARGA